MTKKEITIFAICLNLIIAFQSIPIFATAVGTASISAQAYTVDENDTVYLIANRQIRVSSPDGTVSTFRSPLNSADAIDVVGKCFRVFAGKSYVMMDNNGAVIERGRLDDWVATDKRVPVKEGNSTYHFRSIFGFYRITKETEGNESVRYRMPVTDMVLRLMRIIGMLAFVVFCGGVPLYLFKHNRFARDGTILPPSARDTK